MAWFLEVSEQILIMKQIFGVVIALLVFSTTNTALAQARLLIDNSEKPAATVQVQGNKDDIKNALDVYFEKMGSNLKKSGGLYVAENVSIPQLSTEKLDVYIKVSQLGRDKNNLSDVVMAVKPSSDVFAGDSSHREIFVLLPAYLQSFDAIVKDFVKQRTIDGLNKQSAKATKKQEKLKRRAAKKGEQARKLDKEAQKVD